MTPELQLLLERMHDDIRGIDDRTRVIEERLASKAGAEKVRRGLIETAKWGLALCVAAITGHIAAHR